MTIVHLLKSNRLSGAENVVLNIINICKDSNYKMLYCSPNGTIKETLNENNIPFYLINSFSLFSIFRMLKKIKPKIIHAHDYSASIISAILFKKNNIISHIHVNKKSMSKMSFSSILYLISSFKYKHIFWVSESALNDFYFYKYIANKSSVLENIIDMDWLATKVSHNLYKYNFDIVFVGRITYQKNPHLLISIIQRIKIYLPNIKCAIIGDGDLIDEISGIIYENELNENIKLLGFLNNPYEIMSKSKLMLLTSRFEGTPLVVLEALYLGVPVVSSPVDGVKKLIKNSFNGFLATSLDEFVSFALEILQNTELRNRLSLNAKNQSLERNSKSIYKNRLIEIYDL